MENYEEKYVTIEGNLIKNGSGKIFTAVEPSDILIVMLNDGFVNIRRPIFARQLEDYETPIILLKKRPDGNYETFKIKGDQND